MDVPGVELPCVLERKNIPKLARNGPGSGYFPRDRFRLTPDQRSSVGTIFHLHPSNLQKHLKKAAKNLMGVKSPLDQ